jgi:hypothetical protein
VTVAQFDEVAGRDADAHAPPGGAGFDADFGGRPLDRQRRCGEDRRSDDNEPATRAIGYFARTPFSL